MAIEVPKSEEKYGIDLTLPKKGWMDPSVEFRKGTFCYSSTPKAEEALGLPNPRQWDPAAKDWKLPPDWKEAVTIPVVHP